MKGTVWIRKSLRMTKGGWISHTWKANLTSQAPDGRGGTWLLGKVGRRSSLLSLNFGATALVWNLVTRAGIKQ